MLLGEGGEGEQVGRGVLKHLRGLGEAFRELLDDPAVLGPGRGGIGLSEGGAHQGGHHRLGGLGHPAEQVA